MVPREFDEDSIISDDSLSSFSLALIDSLISHPDLECLIPTIAISRSANPARVSILLALNLLFQRPVLNDHLLHHIFLVGERTSLVLDNARDNLIY